MTESLASQGQGMKNPQKLSRKIFFFTYAILLVTKQINFSPN
jgi:hypothetical protein